MYNITHISIVYLSNKDIIHNSKIAATDNLIIAAIQCINIPTSYYLILLLELVVKD